MDIRKGRSADKKWAEEIWGSCFEKPTDPFFRWYFKECYKPSQLLIGEVDGQAVCNVHRRPYKVCVRDRSFVTEYFVGVATEESRRGKGYASALLQGAMREARRDGKGFVILMPSAALFYQRLGFAFYTFQWERTALTEHMSLSVADLRVDRLTSEREWSVLDMLYDRFTQRRSGFALRAEADWKRRIRGQLSEGNVAVVYERGKPAGYFFYTAEDGNLLAGESVWTEEETGRRGLQLLCEKENALRCTWYAPLDDKSFFRWHNGAEHTYIGNRTFPMMMGRIVNPVTAFEGLPCAAKTEGALTILLQDDLLKENNGIYRLFAKKGVLHMEKSDEKEDAELSVDALASWFFGVCTLRDLTESRQVRWRSEGMAEKAVPLWTATLPEKANWVSEWY